MEALLSKEIDGNKFEILIDVSIFSKHIILKSAHNFLEKGYFFFKRNDGGNIIVQFLLKEGVNEKAENIIGSFTDELLNNSLRETIFEENKEIRTEIITSALQNSLREAELPNTWKGYEESDGEYFNGGSSSQGQNDQIDFDKDIDEILKEIENDPDLKIDEEEIEKILKEIEMETENNSEIQDNTPVLTVNRDAVAEMKAKFKN